MYNLLEYGNNYSMTLAGLWNYYRDKVNDSANEIDDNDNKINNNKTTTCIFLESKKKIIGSMPNSNNVLDAEVAAPLKHLSNFWKSSDLALINCEIELGLKWTKKYVISEISRTFRAVGDPPEQEVATATTGETFQIDNVKSYVPVATLLINYNIKYLENLKPGFKRAISWSNFLYLK